MSDNNRFEFEEGSAAEAVLDPGIVSGRHRRRLFLLGALAVLLAGVLALDIYYMVTKKPLAEMLPSAVAAAKTLPPTYVTSFYGMSSPLGVAVSPDGQRIYVGETEADRLIRVLDRTGKELLSFNAPTKTAYERAPTYMAVDGKGQVYVADRLRQKVSIFSPEGSFVSDVQPPADALFVAPIGVSFDRSGNLLVADATKDAHSVVVMDPQGNLVRRLGKSGTNPGEFSFPNQAAADSKGRIYVSNGNNGRVDMFGADGNYIGILAEGSAKGAVGMPRGIAVDSLDRLYVVDTIGCTVQVFDVSGSTPSYLFNFGTEGSGDGQMTYPTGIAVDATGRIYVADRVNDRVQVWSY